MRTILMLDLVPSEASCSLSPSQVAGQPSSDAGGSDDPAILDISVL